MASSFEGWTEGMIVSIVFVLIFGGVVIYGMNDLHSKSYEIEGLETTELEQTFEIYQDSMEQNIEGGEVSFLGGSVVLTLLTSWSIIKSLFGMLMFFVTGGWIETLITYMQLPDTLGWGLRGIFITAMGFIILRILFNRSQS